MYIHRFHAVCIRRHKMIKAGRKHIRISSTQTDVLREHRLEEGTHGYRHFVIYSSGCHLYAVYNSDSSLMWICHLKLSEVS